MRWRRKQWWDELHLYHVFFTDDIVWIISTFKLSHTKYLLYNTEYRLIKYLNIFFCTITLFNARFHFAGHVEYHLFRYLQSGESQLLVTAFWFSADLDFLSVVSDFNNPLHAEVVEQLRWNSPQKLFLKTPLNLRNIRKAEKLTF